MKKAFFPLFIFLFGCLPLSADAAGWKPVTPENYTPITWVSAKGVASFMQVPENAGYIDYLTVIHLPSTQIKLLSSSTPRMAFGAAVEPFVSTTVQNWAFTRSVAETTKKANPDARFLWNVPFFNVTLPTTDLSLSLKSSDAFGEYITSGSRPINDMASARRMLLVDNAVGTAKVIDFDEAIFVTEGDQAVEGFHPTASPSVSTVQTARLYIGVREEGKELVIYCSKSASAQEASDALTAAGVPVENQMQADGGGSAMCAYNLPGQYFVEPGRALPHLMGAVPVLFRGAVTVDGLNVRSGPGTNNVAVRKLALESPVVVYEEKNGWLRINEKNEWVFAKFIHKVEPVLYKATIVTDRLNVRKGAGTNFGVTRRLGKDVEVKVYEEKSGWVRVSDSEWVSDQHIQQL